MLIVAGILLAMLTRVPRAMADDIDPDADVPDASTLPDFSPPDQVLEIPQQCDQDAVAMLCDRSPEPATSSDADADSSQDPSIDTADVGTLSDYTNQNAALEASAAGTMNVPAGFYPPVLAPGPVIVSSFGAGGPGTYQQWASGPGFYRSMVPGPGYIQPMPLGYRPALGNFGAQPFGMGGGHFGRR
jgi:hypothetical protein